MAQSEAQREEIFGHPKGLYICFLTEMWERFSFYGMKFLLLLYLTKYHLFTDSAGLDVLAAYAGLVYALPVIGGMLADRYLGMRKAVTFGGIMLCLGHLGMAFEGEQASLVDGVVTQDTFALSVFYFSLALIIVGVGFLKPNISTIVGKLYPVGDDRRDSGFTIFYMGINLGSFAATLICGYLGETYGWGYGFGAAGIGMFFGLLVFLWGQKFLDGHAEPDNPEMLKEKVFGITRENVIYILSILSVSVLWYIVQSDAIVHYSLNILSGGALLWIIYFIIFHCDPVQRGQMGVLASLIVFTVVFWALFEQSAASMTLYADRVVDRVLLDKVFISDQTTMLYVLGVVLILIPFVAGYLGLKKYREFNESEKRIANTISGFVTLVLVYLGIKTFGFASEVSETIEGIPVIWEATAVMVGSLNAMFIIFMAPVIAWLWTFLSKNRIEPGTPVKFAIGILFAGLGFGALVFGANYPDAMGKVSLIWLVLAYFLHTLGELCLSPVGLSSVTKLSVPKVVGFMMGVWFLATAYSEYVAAQIAKFASVETTGGEVADVSQTLGIYTDFFGSLMWVGVVVAVVLLALYPLLRKGMHGVK